LIAVLAAVLSGSPVVAQIQVRLSIKYILDANGNRPAGHYATEQNIRDVIDDSNEAMDRWGRGYRWVIVGPIGEVSETTAPGSSQFFELTGGVTNHDLEDAAEADPTGYIWRTDAVNVYIVNCCAAAGTIPSLASDSGYRVVFVSANVNTSATDSGQHARRIIWTHELGHYFDLYHPWGNDHVTDTRTDADPNQCIGAFSCTPGGSDECCCSQKVINLENKATSEGWTDQEFEDIRFNVMGYYGATDCVGLGEDMITIENMRLTDGQLDRWTDATRRYRASDVDGLTYFVDWRNTTAPYNGYSTDPHRTIANGIGAAGDGGGDIVLVRAGQYAENLTVTKPVTIRANRGSVVVGQ
jgi:hypothetical protein